MNGPPNDDLTNDQVNATRRLHVMLRREDMDRLEMISATYGISQSGALRMALVAMCRQLGLGKD